MRTNHTVKIVLVTCALAVPFSGTAVAAETGLDGAASPGQSSTRLPAPLGTEGFAKDYPYFAGYHQRASGPTSVETVTVIVDPCQRDVPAIVAGSVSIFDADYDVAGAYATSSCYVGDPYLSIDLVSPDGRSHRRSLDVQIGDQIALSASFDGNESLLTATNLTRGWTETLEGAFLQPTRVAVGALTGADKLRRLPIPNFGELPFTGTLVNGEPLGASKPRALDLVIDYSGQRMTVGRIQDGTDFEVRSHKR